MRFYFDTEFIDTSVVIHPLSIAVVNDKRHVFYAVITDTSRSLADAWVKENVIAHLNRSTDEETTWAKRVTVFYGPKRAVSAKLLEWITKEAGDQPVTFWADYAAYDFVVLSQLYGTLLQRPAAWPMFVNDIQTIRPEYNGERVALPEPKDAHHAISDAINVHDRYHFIMGLISGLGLSFSRAFDIQIEGES